jgi:biopolymer transport protein ExbB/TolQ
MTQSPRPLLRHASLDPEARLGLPCGALTTPSATTCLVATVIVGGAVYGAGYATSEGEWGAVVWEYLTGFGRIPIPIVILSIWSLMFLMLKALKIRAQRAALRIHFVPEDTAFVLNASTADAVVDAIDRSADDPGRFMYLSRARAVLRVMRNLGRVSDVDDLIASRGDQEEATIDSGYTILRGFIWAIPVLGFIGTVIGLTQAMGRFGTALRAAGKDVEAITQQLTGVLAGLDTAFITTAEALIAVIFIHLFQTIVRRADEQLLDDVRKACLDSIVSRVRISRQDA